MEEPQRVIAAVFVCADKGDVRSRPFRPQGGARFFRYLAESCATASSVSALIEFTPVRIDRAAESVVPFSVS